MPATTTSGLGTLIACSWARKRRRAPPWLCINLVAISVAPARHGCQEWTGSECFQAAALEYQVQPASPLWPRRFAEPDELYLCAGVEGKGAGEPSGLTWEHAGMVHETHLRVACPCSEYGGSRPGRAHPDHRAKLARQGVEWPVHAGVQWRLDHYSDHESPPAVRLLDHVWRASRKCTPWREKLLARRSRRSWST